MIKLKKHQLKKKNQENPGEPYKLRQMFQSHNLLNPKPD
jgi:hypothetical protein